MDTFAVTGPDITTAWIRACRELLSMKEHRGYHTVVRIEDPTLDDLTVRAELDRILAVKNKQPVKTVANTIFPAALARTCRTHDQLVRRYRDLYPTARRMHPGNKSGTYFGRLIDYPGVNGNIDQIGAVIHRLRQQARQSNPMTACYEANLVEPQTDEAAEPITISTPVRVPGRDNGIMAFPCLSHCSFQLDRSGRVHLLALYRSHFMVERAYGNYMGLGGLLAHVARHGGLERGQLTVTAGYAQLDGNALTQLRLLVSQQAARLAA